MASIEVIQFACMDLMEGFEGRVLLFCYTIFLHCNPNNQPIIHDNYSRGFPYILVVCY